MKVQLVVGYLTCCVKEVVKKDMGRSWRRVLARNNKFGESLERIKARKGLSCGDVDNRTLKGCLDRIWLWRSNPLDISRSDSGPVKVERGLPCQHRRQLKKGRIQLTLWSELWSHLWKKQQRLPLLRRLPWWIETGYFLCWSVASSQL